ncbi:YebC/PmpR family DNA-binding transcriptional regulator [Candidatus Falkowbacteria bacterium CG10_big_fil_rev_8_21_14_0_10_39_11]|uniref:Probable transcriptional regulatory protein COT97_05180 n=1 Tax=Candidatus Falkowbacteria bacterium CG10_big_fil_rev_8_21_14_0_10_39_11 TaxID=1974565 RepID=A0A2H0V5X2_9BACT|nr:MAG: YebC/PmpR family DNA-binding transcriptional regulator [Candidatus Falkowbacteria bacterium CG10_big_fil_rev_8_21_14_0_10_39_11]
MSGHSKWATIQTRKGAQDKKRANLFSKATKNIIIAAREGADLETNFKLRLAVDKAKAVNVPKDNIERAIAKGSGAAGADLIEEVIYEGYGPSGIAILIEAATDNRNRTSSEMKHILTKYGGSLGGPNSVQWMFDHKGVIRIKQDQYEDKDMFLLELIDFGAEDVIEEEGGVTITTEIGQFVNLKKALDEKNIETEYSELEWIAKDEVAVSEEVQKKLAALFDALEDDDDAVNYYSNAAI